MKKEEHKVGYSFFKVVLGGVFKLYYRPKVFNKEVVPSEGPIIICSNHMHLFDQNLACISIKRMLHYMAKDEHLNGKFGWFFKLSGCIGVNRSIHDQEAKDHAMEVLNNNYALGLFPEGTRNQLVGKDEIKKRIFDTYYKDDLSYEEFNEIIKTNMVAVSEINLLEKLLNDKVISKKEFKDYALDSAKSIEKLYDDKKISYDDYVNSFFLPFKFGAVSMAQKTGATIVPVVVTGKYTFKNNHLNARFGNPFKVSKEMNLEDANKKLFDEMVRLKLEGLSDIRKGRI